jgi:hypothetical protein
MDYDAIFAEYYPLYRGQASVPGSGDREYLLGIPMANNAIRKWDRADGVLWNELKTSAQVEQDGDLVVDTTATVYQGSDNMRKPPAKVRLTDPANSQHYFDLTTVSQDKIEDINPQSSYAYFTGSANTGWSFYLNSPSLSTYNAWTIDYLYIKRPTLITTGTDIPDMSDPNFIVQSMLATRFVNSRNGFAFSTAKADATDALRNMIIENNSGTYGDSWNLLKETPQSPGFGKFQW